MQNRDSAGLQSRRTVRISGSLSQSWSWGHPTVQSHGPLTQ